MHFERWPGSTSADELAGSIYEAAHRVTSGLKRSRSAEHIMMSLDFPRENSDSGPFLYELAILTTTLDTNITRDHLSDNRYFYPGLLLNLLEVKYGTNAKETKETRKGTWTRCTRLYQQAEEGDLKPILDSPV